LQAAGLYYDAQVDDARLVIESLKSARALGAEAVNHAPLVEIVHGAHGKIAAVGVQDRLARRRRVIRTHTVVNAAGPSVERVRGLDRPIERPEMRPAKGVHIVIPGDRIHTQATITFEAGDGRHAFLSPWDDVAMIGTTDTFTREIDEPLTTQADVDYLLSAANRAFPRAGLTKRDILGVFAGVRPLAVDEDTERPPSAVSREHRISEDDSGLVSVCGGKLTLYRSMGEAVVDRVLRRLPRERRSAVGPSRTWELPLREDSFDCRELEAELCRRFGIASQHAEHLVRTWGADAGRVLREAAPEWRRPIGSSRYLYAEIPWSFRTECPATLCDLLERRLRLALFAKGQGLPELKTIARIASRAAGWDAERTRAEAATYAATVRRRYQLAVADAPEPAQSAA
jgi:glycerol-3-phosphate dehydrogenase